MRVMVVYKQDSEHARVVDEFMHDFSSRTGRTLEVVDPESRDGIALCEAYDILQFPAVIAISDDGQVQNMWLGVPLPTISEVSYYA